MRVYRHSDKEIRRQKVKKITAYNSEGRSNGSNW